MTRRLLSAIYLLSAVAGLSVPAAGEELRELCVDRPGKDTPPCIVDAGHVIVEVGALEFSREKDEGEKSRSYTFGDTLVRLGVSERSEVQLGFAPYNIVRTRDRATGERRTTRGIGDLVAGYKYNFANPDGSDTSAAAQLFVSAPTGRDEIGAGTWEGGIIIPVSFELSDEWSLTLDPEVDWRGDEDGHGHHVAWAGVASLGRDLGGGLEASAELWASVDQDPMGDRTEASADVALAWIPETNQNLQFDAELDVGLTRDTPGLEAAVGVAYRF